MLGVLGRGSGGSGVWLREMIGCGRKMILAGDQFYTPFFLFLQLASLCFSLYGIVVFNVVASLLA